MVRAADSLVIALKVRAKASVIDRSTNTFSKTANTWTVSANSVESDHAKNQQHAPQKRDFIFL